MLNNYHGLIAEITQHLALSKLPKKYETQLKCLLTTGISGTTASRKATELWDLHLRRQVNLNFKHIAASEINIALFGTLSWGLKKWGRAINMQNVVSLWFDSISSISHEDDSKLNTILDQLIEVVNCFKTILPLCTQLQKEELLCSWTNTLICSTEFEIIWEETVCNEILSKRFHDFWLGLTCLYSDLPSLDYLLLFRVVYRMRGPFNSFTEEQQKRVSYRLLNDVSSVEIKLHWLGYVCPLSYWLDPILEPYIEILLQDIKPPEGRFFRIPWPAMGIKDENSLALYKAVVIRYCPNNMGMACSLLTLEHFTSQRDVYTLIEKYNNQEKGDQIDIGNLLSE